MTKMKCMDGPNPGNANYAPWKTAGEKLNAGSVTFPDSICAPNAGGSLMTKRISVNTVEQCLFFSGPTYMMRRNANMRESTAGRRFPIGENVAYVISRKRISLITICRSRPSEKSAYKAKQGLPLYAAPEPVI